MFVTLCFSCSKVRIESYSTKMHFEKKMSGKNIKGWVAKERAFMWDLGSYVCMWKTFWNMCAMWVLAACFRACNVRLLFCTFFGTKRPDDAIVGLKTFHFQTFFHVLEGHFLFQNLLLCFGTSFPVFESVFLFLNLNILFCFRIPIKLLKKWLKNVHLQKVRVRLGSATTLNWRCAPKSGRTRWSNSQ